MRAVAMESAVDDGRLPHDGSRGAQEEHTDEDQVGAGGGEDGAEMWHQRVILVNTESGCAGELTRHAARGDLS